MSNQSNAFDTLPLSDDEVALLRSVLEQSSCDSGRIVERLAVQSNNPRIGADDRCIYVLSAADIELAKTALQAAIATAPAPARKRRITMLLQWVHGQTDDLSVA